MMKLTTCAFVVTLVSLVTASPYGYGVKGGAGASARAESSASAGAFGGQGDIPVAIPFGNGFSGSFSKSSSSSSSSSSASSSSSSSSFSFSGSGTGGFSGQGTHGNTGCKSGLCPNSGLNEISGNHGSTGTGAGLHGAFSAANAAAVGGSGASPGAGCGGPSCDNNSGKCSSGKCQSKPQGENDYDTNNKCTSGSCTTQTGPSASPNDETEDIQVLPHSAKSDHDSKDAKYDKTAGQIDTDCSGNNCGSSTGHSQPNSVPGVTNSYHNTPSSNKLQPSNINSGSKPGYQPATELETPKQDSKSSCTSGLCNSGQPQPVHGSSPSSYNAHIPGTYGNDNEKPICTNGICNIPLKGSYLHATYRDVLPTNNLSPQKEPSFNYPGSTNCRGTNCNSASSSQISDRPLVTGSVAINSNIPLHDSASLRPTNCNLPNCKPQHTTSSTIGSNGQPKPVTFSGTVHKVKPSKEDKPIYTGGFGAPAGILNPNDYTIPTAAFSPGYAHLDTGLSATGCSSSNCLGQISSPGATPSSSYDSHKPRGDVRKSEQNKPKYTGGFGGPPGLLKPNEYNINTPIASKPIQSTSLPHNTLSTPSSCTSPTCFGSSPIAGGKPVLVTHSTDILGSTDKLPTYTGDFGGPAGILKPNEFDIKITKKPLHTTNPPYQKHPHVTLSTTVCNAPNCHGYTPIPKVTTFVQTGSYGTIKPNSGTVSTTQLPPYASGFGGPSGVHKTNQLSSPHAAPNNQFPNHSEILSNTVPSITNVAGCTTPSCHSSSSGTTVAIHLQPPFNIAQPNITPHPSSVTYSGYTSNYDTSVGIANPIAPAVAPISSYTNTPPFKPSGIHSVECRTANCAAGSTNINYPSESFAKPKLSNPQYTEGPTSTVTPNNILYNAPFDGTTSTNCKTSNCANLPSAGTGVNTQSGSQAGSKVQSPPYTNGFGVPSGLLKPNDYAIPSSPAPASAGECSGSNCNPQVTSPSSPGYNSAPSGYHPSTQSPSPQYTGGFGGPSGFAKPGDHSYNTPSSGSHSIPCKTANCAVPSTATAGTNAQSVLPNTCSGSNCIPQVTTPSSPGYNSLSSGSHPSSRPSSPSYTGGFGGPSGTVKPGDHLYNIPSTESNSVPCNTPNCAISPTMVAEVNSQSDAHNQDQSPPYMSGFGAPSGLLKPNDYAIPSSPAPASPGECSGGNCNSQVTSPSSPGYNSSPSGYHPSTQSSSPQYTGGFGGPSGIAKPNDHSYNAPSDSSHSTPCKTANCARPSTATAGANTQTGSPEACSGGYCNPQISSPGHNLAPSNSHLSTQPSSPQYTGTFGGPSGIAKPGDHLYNGPSADSNSYPCKTANCALSPTSAVNAPAGSHAGSNNQSPPYTSGFGAPSGFLKPNDYSVPAINTSPNNHNTLSAAATSPGACSGGNCNVQVMSPSFTGYNSVTSGSHPSSNPQYTDSFTGPSGTAKPGDHSYSAPSAGSSSIPCKTANCAGSPLATTGPYTSSQGLIPPYTSDIGAPSSSKPSGYSSTTLSTSPNVHDKPLPLGSSPGMCSNGHCNSKVTSPSSHGYDSAPSGSHSSSKPSSPQYTGGFGGLTSNVQPGDHSYNAPSAGSDSIPCKSSNCAISPSATAAANAHSGSQAGSKDQSPPYTSGFGAPPGLLKPNDYSIPAISTSPNDHTKPSQAGSLPGGCTSGNCNVKAPSPSSYGYNGASSGVHASASSTASAVAYTGGFGGPPGFLKPNDDGKVDLAKIVGGYHPGSHHGAGIKNSPHDLFNTSAAGQAGAHSNIGAGSVAGATAYSGSVASANSGSYGFNTHGIHQVGGVKGSSPCGGGCGGHKDGLSGSGSSAAAGARSLASAGAFGGSFASSSASAHASAGSYTKGGYGKR